MTYSCRLYYCCRRAVCFEGNSKFALDDLVTFFLNQPQQSYDTAGHSGGICMWKFCF